MSIFEIHEDDRAMIKSLHSRFADNVGDAVIQLQDKSYEIGRKRGLADGQKQRDELQAFAEEVRRSGDTRLASMAIAAIASVKGGAA